MDKLLNFLGLCRRAGKLLTGNDVVTDAVRNGEARLVIVSSDVSKNTEKKLRAVCGSYSVEILKLNRTTDELSASIGKFAAVAATTDSGFAKKLSTLIMNDIGGTCV